MSTKCHVILHDSPTDEGILLFNHWDGYPEAMLPKLEILLDHAQDVLTAANHGLDSYKVAAILIAESVDDRGIPEFYPCRSPYEYVDYTYLVNLSDEGYDLTVDVRNGVDDDDDENDDDDWEG